jgi:hypothetical protein
MRGLDPRIQARQVLEKTPNHQRLDGLKPGQDPDRGVSII